jgi:hypothetical protein
VVDLSHFIDSCRSLKNVLVLSVFDIDREAMDPDSLSLEQEVLSEEVQGSYHTLYSREYNRSGDQAEN